MQLEDFDAREGLEAYGILVGHTFVVQVFRHAPGTIATHHGFGTIIVEDAHGEVGIGTSGCTNEDESVAAYAEVRSAPFDGCCGGVGDMMQEGVDVDVVVACPVHFGERNGHYS